MALSQNTRKVILNSMEKSVNPEDYSIILLLLQCFYSVKIQNILAGINCYIWQNHRRLEIKPWTTSNKLLGIIEFNYFMNKLLNEQTDALLQML